MKVLSRGSTRMLSTSRVLCKDEKSKQLLKNLGLSLQKGNIKTEDSENQQTQHAQTPTNEASDKSTPANPQETEMSSSNQSYQDMINRLNETYDTISHMTTDDILIQENLDQGRQLFSNPSHHYLNRKEIIRSLPSDLDLFNPEELKGIDEVYDKLALLDSDKSVQYKYYKRYLKKYTDPVNVMIQEFNGVDKKFRLLRRKEMESLSLAPGAYLYHENLFSSPYNVVGFDTSISGLPLRTGKHRLNEKCYPQEFIEDLQMYRSKIPIHKRDLDFIEQEDSAININPRKVNSFRMGERANSGFRGALKPGINGLYTKDNGEPLDLSDKQRVDEFFNKIYSNIETPTNTIHIDSIENYNSIDLNRDLVIRIENEILIMKKSLQNEIEQFMKSSLNTRILMYNAQQIKHNQYRLCESKSTTSMNSDSMLVINYSLKEFNLIPNYGLVLNTLRQRKNLINHLYKVFLINLEDQIDTLFRIKYYHERDMNRLMKRVVKNIGHVIKFILQKLFKPIQHSLPSTDHGVKLSKRLLSTDESSTDYDALIYSPYLNRSNCFKRIYWLNNRARNYDQSVTKNSSVSRKGGMHINWKSFDNLIEY